MDRIEKVREVVDEILLKMTKDEARRHAYLHLYGVSQACALLALKRKEDVELAVIAGMLHDIYTYANLDSRDHAHKGAEMAREILDSLHIFEEDEKDLVCTAIYNHSDKSMVHGWLDEILKDADVMQHVLYNPLLDIKQHEQTRFGSLKEELDLKKVDCLVTRRKIMKVLLINGSPKANGNTARALEEMVTVFEKEGIETEIVHVGNKDVRGCVACGFCYKNGKCVVDDIVNECAPKFAECDGMVVASPVYYASANGTLISFLDRLFYCSYCDKRMKVGASVAVARRGGCSATFDQLNKYFTISGMPVASSQYWNSVHGAAPGEVEEDAEGLQTMRTLAKNMAFLMKSIALGKEQFGLPEKEAPQRTNFIR